MNNLLLLYWKFKLISKFRQGDFELPKGPRCLIFLAADYGNLGDVAITYAQKKFLQKHFPEHDVIEVPAAQTLTNLYPIKRQIRPDDVVTVVGGGNMGDMYGDLELLRLMIVRAFPKNRIILFPQTIDYTDSREAQWLIRLSKKVYRHHQRLTMGARETVSYEMMKRLYRGVDIRLTPDIVMGLDERNVEIEREPIATFCLRNDREKADNSGMVDDIKRLCQTVGLSIEYRDTHIGGSRYSQSEKYSALGNLWNHFRRSRLVVTDRLHGMIFAYITGTPALVLPNSNFKVSACYNWIKDCGFIKMYSSDTKLSDIFAAEPKKLNLSCLKLL